jgi:hypothetical protein
VPLGVREEERAAKSMFNDVLGVRVDGYGCYLYLTVFMNVSLFFSIASYYDDLLLRGTWDSVTVGSGDLSPHGHPQLRRSSLY